jgi:hypothetical protein
MIFIAAGTCLAFQEISPRLVAGQWNVHFPLRMLSCRPGMLLKTRTYKEEGHSEKNWNRQVSVIHFPYLYG